MSYKKDSQSLNIPPGSITSTPLSPEASRRKKVPETVEEVEYHLKFIDPLFQTASHIVQTRLPASGPIQPTYKEKLLLYSFFKQAVNGDVQKIASRPGLFDMLGRAKWDSWKKLEGLQPVDAKKLYVDTLLKVCDMSARIFTNNCPRSGILPLDHASQKQYAPGTLLSFVSTNMPCSIIDVEKAF
ncbi:uncharacterized protein MELLADRAFT_50568 [Melampsora larici-populina 98AG31]|uniref:ACB domain-containing protein n=1 Tax=Melampsora larici-populina (strain 98AG31 / pathotype 3-4-7) TaxID=747676 RepID=F4S626_MELLP|nr:uncharacterized protein MELLADRAFT_50568 [Melampsora larici-populina 98AG31]EGF99915.1 hypothetical protein MELLADRAFT_50568 [Melampsora larici-populina 98AG31]